MTVVVHYRPLGSGSAACGRLYVASSSDPARATCRKCLASPAAREAGRIDDLRRQRVADPEGDDLARAVREGLRRAGHAG